MSTFTKKDLVEMWKRPVERQYNIAIVKILEAIRDTEGDIAICFSGGKDSALLLDMYSEIVKTTEYGDRPIKVRFANTTNETAAMLAFIGDFIPWVEKKHGVTIQFQEVKPRNGLVWPRFVLDNGIPLISKAQSKAIRIVKRDMLKVGCDYETITRLAKLGDMACVEELLDLGFSKTGILSLTGYIFRKGVFGRYFTLSRRWLPMVACKADLTEQCCVKIKEAALNALSDRNIMTGEQAAESAAREAVYLRTGCNARLANGDYKSKPFGAMTLDGILYALKYRGTPICADYGCISCEKGHYTCSKTNRTGCALCGFGCQYDPERFIRLQEAEPAKVRFAFKPIEQGGAGYKEAIEHMNEYCRTNIAIPQVD